MARNAFLRSTGSRLKPETFHLNIEEPFVVGRDPGTNMTIENDENISENQFILRYCKDWNCWTVEDCKSKLGTYLNAYKVFQNDRWDLNEGDKIIIPIGWNQDEYVWEFGFIRTDFDVFNSIGKVICRFCDLPFQNHGEKYEHEWTFHGLKREFSCELCTKRTWNRIQMEKHKTTTHNISEASGVPNPNESDSTCPVCKKVFKSARIRNLHFKFNKKCNPTRNLQKFSVVKSTINKMKAEKKIKKTPQTKIVPTAPQFPDKDKNNADQDNIDYVAEGQKIEAFYQKSNPSKEKDKSHNNENQMRPQTNVLYGISDEQVDDWLASFNDENDDPVPSDKDNHKENSNETNTVESSSGNIKVVPCVVKVKKVDANDFVAKFKCDDCHQEFRSMISLQRHTTWHKKQCKICNKIFHSYEKLHTHRKMRSCKFPFTSKLNQTEKSLMKKGAKQVTKPDVNPKNNDYDSKDTKACNIDKVLPNSQPFPNCDTTENTLAYPRKRTVSNNGSPDSKKRKHDNAPQEDLVLDDNRIKVDATETHTNSSKNDSLCEKCGQLFSNQNNMKTCDSCHTIVNLVSTLDRVVTGLVAAFPAESNSSMKEQDANDDDDIVVLEESIKKRYVSREKYVCRVCQYITYGHDAIREHIAKNTCLQKMEKKKAMLKDSSRGTKIRNNKSTTTHSALDDLYKIRGTECVLSVKSKPQTDISEDVMSQLIKVEDNDSGNLVEKKDS